MRSPKRPRQRSVRPHRPVTAPAAVLTGAGPAPHGPQTWRARLGSSTETERVGAAIGRLLRGGEVLALHGDLGAGKTTLVRGIAAGLGVPRRTVSSPTFALIHEYAGRLPLVHADLYRLDGETELAHLGLSEYLNGRAVVAIEWADKAARELPGHRLEIRMTHTRDQARSILVRARGKEADRVLRGLMRSRPRRSVPHGTKQERVP
jgi:tRNA threonylcarbamoyladenosine biosynthesis protein TsaE